MARKGTTKFESNKQEKKVAEDMEGTTVMGSGSLWFAKADVRAEMFGTKYLVECKTTKNNYYSLTVATWDKISKEALKDGYRIPLLQIDLENGYERQVVLNRDDFDSLFNNLDLRYNYLNHITKNKSVRITSLYDARPYNLYTTHHTRYFLDEYMFETYKLNLAVVYWDEFLNLVKKKASEENGEK